MTNVYIPMVGLMNDKEFTFISEKTQIWLSFVFVGMAHYFRVSF